MAKNDGGPAFPTLTQVDKFVGERTSTLGTAPTYQRSVELHAGLSLRDYFAGQVISQCQLVVADLEPPPDIQLTQLLSERFARRAYQIADAMIAERAK